MKGLAGPLFSETCHASARQPWKDCEVVQHGIAEREKTQCGSLEGPFDLPRSVHLARQFESFPFSQHKRREPSVSK
jgi:hypothetical protein